MKQQHKQMIKWSWFNADKKEVETAEATEEGKERRSRRCGKKIDY